MRSRAIGIVLKGDEILLIHRNVNNEDYFVFPGGGVEEGEQIEQAVTREVYEESGITIRVKKLLYIVTDEKSEHNFYLCDYISGYLRREEENGKPNTFDSKMPSWNKIDNLSKVKIFPLEVRDWFVEDFKNGFTHFPKVMNSLISERRIK